MTPNEAQKAKARELVNDTPSDMDRSDRADLQRDIAQALADEAERAVQDYRRCVNGRPSKQIASEWLEYVDRHWKKFGRGVMEQEIANRMEQYAERAVDAAVLEWTTSMKTVYRDMNKTPMQVAEENWTILNARVIERAVDAAVKAEREACAEIVRLKYIDASDRGLQSVWEYLRACWDAIRSRGTP